MYFLDPYYLGIQRDLAFFIYLHDGMVKLPLLKVHMYVGTYVYTCIRRNIYLARAVINLDWYLIYLST